MKKLLLIMTLITLITASQAQILHPVKWSYAAKKISSNIAVVFIKAIIDDGWHIYSINQKDGGPVKTSFTFVQSTTYTPIGNITEPTPQTEYDKTFAMDVLYFEKSVIFKQKIRLKTVQIDTINGKLNFMVCNDQKCLPPEDVEFSIPVK